MSMAAGASCTASKGGLAALTLSSAREAAPHGVTVNGIAPAYIRTPVITDFLSETEQRELLAQIPDPWAVSVTLGKWATWYFLASPLCGFITGEIIDINGGLHMD